MANKVQNNILTVLICCYNSGRFLQECFDSLVHQNISGPSYKVLFINDGSIDDSLEIANLYCKRLENLIVLNNKKNEGLSSCCNKALKIIDTSYFMRLDADDYLSPNAIGEILKEISSSNRKDFIIFKRWDIRNNEFKKVKISDDVYTWIAVGTAFNAEIVRSVGGYSNEYWEEYDLYIKLLEAGYEYRISPKCIYYYRRGHGGMTQDCEKKKKGIESLLSKWGGETLDRCGNFKRILEYYGI